MSDSGLTIVSPLMVMHVRASNVDAPDHSVEWTIGYAPELAPDGSRFLLFRLVAEGDDGLVEVEIAAGQTGGEFGVITEEDTARLFQESLAESPSLELVWDVARSTARSLVGLIDAEVHVPLSSPEPIISRLVPRSETEDT